MSQTETKEKKETKQEVICDIPKSETEVIRVSTNEYKGHSFVDLRLFFKDRESGEFRPTRKGLVVKREFLNDLVEGIWKAEQAIQAKQ